nr:MAG TPA: collagen triple helix repeat protein [Crassvirales sp.]
MYHYINGLGKVWVGTEQPPQDEFEINSLWLHPTDNKDPLWELLAFDCREGHEEWVRVGGAGGGSDPGTFTAIVENVASTASADANVVLDGNTFKFSFDLPKGERGEPGQPGAPGSDGQQGIPGEDGEGVEYIFTRTETSDPTGVPPVPVDPPYDNPPAPWTDDPTGVDNVYRYEWVSKRIKVHNVWSVFSEPSIWARYSYDGADGKDGKDIEFIFARKQSEVAPATPPTKQVDDYVPTPEETSDNQTWTDDATGVDSIWRYEYVSERTKVNDVWGEFSKPAMWARYSLDGRPGTPPNYTIFAFYKGNTQPSIPTSESLPPFTDNGNQWVAAPDSTGKWWMAAGNVEWVDDSEKVTSWSVPVQATGEDGVAPDYYNFKYAVNSTPDKAPDLNKSSADPGSSWADEVPANPKGTYLWMIIGRFSQGELQGTWSDPIRLTGQDGSNGSSGTDGLTARILYQKTSSPSQVPALNPSDPNPGSLWASVAPEWTEGEAVWMITAMLTSGGDLSGTWQGPFLMTGSPGPAGESPKLPNYNTYAYQKAENKPSKPTFTDPSEITIDGTWKPYPNSAGNWWECIGNTSGETGLILTWGEVLQVNGRDGVAASYTSFVFKKSDSKPSAPTSTDPIPTSEGWEDAPGGSGRWWMSTATISDNAAHLPWSDPVQVTGEDGADGAYTDFKYRKNNSPTTPPAIDKDVDNPTGWSDAPPTIGNGEYLWMSKANKTADGRLGTSQSDHWTTPVRINGEKGDEGTPGVDGDSIELRFSVNSSNTSAPSINVNSRNPSVGSTSWDTVPPAKEPAEFMWMSRATIAPDDTLRGTWSEPVCISGAPGIQGETGPAGAPGPAGPSGVSGVPGVSYELRYCLGTATVPTGTQTPGKDRDPAGWTTAVPTSTSGDNIYIWFIQARIRDYDPNIGGSGDLEGSWSVPARLQGINGLDGMPGSPGAKGQIVYPAGVYSADTIYTTTSEKAPYVFDTGDNNYYVLNTIMSWDASQQVKKTPHEDAGEGGTHSWILMESFDAIYANIGVFGTALVGSAVFWDDWMYSQRGIDNQGDPSSDFEKFSPSAPMGPDALFTPNIAFNFKTGDGFLANGKIKFNADGSVILNRVTIKDSQSQEYTEYNATGVSPILVSSFNAVVKGSANSGDEKTVAFDFLSKYKDLQTGIEYEGSILNKSEAILNVSFTSLGYDSSSGVHILSGIYMNCLDSIHQTSSSAFTNTNQFIDKVVLAPDTYLRYTVIFTDISYNSQLMYGKMQVSNSADFRYSYTVGGSREPSRMGKAIFRGAIFDAQTPIIAVGTLEFDKNGNVFWANSSKELSLKARSGVDLSIRSDLSNTFNPRIDIGGTNPPVPTGFVVITSATGIGVVASDSKVYYTPVVPAISYPSSMDSTAWFSLTVKPIAAGNSFSSGCKVSFVIYDMDPVKYFPI